MKSYYVYILQCAPFDRLRVTLSCELVEPYEHQEGLIEGCYTHNKRPVELMHVEEFRDIVEAISMEKQIKGWSRQKKKALIAGNYQKLVELSKSHPSTSSG
jgi:putative endonuclease